jgi:hypothetical protein
VDSHPRYKIPYPELRRFVQLRHQPKLSAVDAASLLDGSRVLLGVSHNLTNFFQRLKVLKIVRFLDDFFIFAITNSVL